MKLFTPKNTLLTLSLAFLGLGLCSAQAEVESAPIVGGTLVSSSELIARRTVGLYFLITENGQKGAAICSGSILDSSHILTAAHCVQGFQAGYVVFSANDVFSALKQANLQAPVANGSAVQPMVSALAFPGFPGMNAANGNAGEFVDLAVITFRGGLPAGYEPAHFLPKNTLLSELGKSPDLTLSGYGMTTPPSQRPSSSSASGFPAGVGTLRKVQVHTDHIASQQIDVFVGGVPHHNACEGDSGGPAMLTLNNDVYVVGVDSRGDCNTTSIYTIVDQENLSSTLALGN